MTRTNRRRFAPLLAAWLMCMGAIAAPAAAMQILEAADHAELAAEISATNVNRIALHGDRIAKVVRSPDGFAVEHDAASGDLYLRPSTAGAAAPVTLFVGTERGFTYRLTLTPVDRESAQILIRNADAAPAAAKSPGASGGPHVAALVRLVRAVARRELLPGYGIETGNRPAAAGLTFEERAGTLDIADGEQLRRWREGLRANRIALARHRNEGLARFNTALAVVETRPG